MAKPQLPAEKKEGDAGLPAIPTRVVTTGIVAIAPKEVLVFEDMGDGTEATGLEHIRLKDRRVPLLRPLAAQAPQCQPVENGGLPGATPGAIFNTTTSETYPRKLGMYVIPVTTDLKYICYKKREEDGSGGGFVSIHEPNDPVVIQRQKKTMDKYGDLFRKLENGQDDDGNDLELVETHMLYCICIKPNEDGSYPGEYGECFPGTFPFSSTQIKQHAAMIERSKNMKYNLRQPGGGIRLSEVAMWTHVWHLRPHLETRGKLSWWGWRFSLAAKNEDGTEKHYTESRMLRTSDLYKMAEDLRANVLEGNAQVDFTKASEQALSRGEGGDASGGAEADIPGI